MTVEQPRSWVRRVGQTALIGALYYTAGKLSLLLAIPPGYAAAVWPASGIALAGTLSLGYHVWPGILIGSFLVNISTALDITSAASALTSVMLAGSIGLERHWRPGSAHFSFGTSHDSRTRCRTNGT
jgi:integral membrane sensor domain MASE1